MRHGFRAVMAYAHVSRNITSHETRRPDACHRQSRRCKPSLGKRFSKLGFEAHRRRRSLHRDGRISFSQKPYRGCVLSLQSVYREEISMIVCTLKRRLPELEIWLSHTDGRQSALAKAMRLGADGLLGEEGLHRIACADVIRWINLVHGSFAHAVHARAALEPFIFRNRR